MVRVINGDLLEANETYIVHQVNCYGAMVPTDDGKVVCNVFGQERFGVGKMHTDIVALSKALTSLAKIIPYNEPIAMPYMIGCGLGGASWDIVYPVIRDIFAKHTVILYRK